MLKINFLISFLQKCAKFCDFSETKINLPSLKKLCFHGAYFKALNAPNLESIASLSWTSLGFLEIESDYRYPEKIKFIMCSKFKTKPIFPNLEHLICETIDAFLPLEKMSRLKRVEIFPKEIFPAVPKETSDLKIIEDLKLQREKLERRDLDIWFCGFKETGDHTAFFRSRFIRDPSDKGAELPVDPFDHLDFNEPLSVLPCSVYLYSPHLTRKFPNLEGIPPNFFRVLINIRGLKISVEVENQNLIRFIKNIRDLEFLSVTRNQFGETFYKELSRVQSIKVLTLKESRVGPRGPKEIDFSYILNLRNIVLMSVESELSTFKISAQLFIEFLRETEDLFNDIAISGRRKKSLLISHFCRSYRVIDPFDIDDRKLTFNSLDELISYVETLPGKNTIFF